MFDRFQNRIRIDATLAVESGLHIGAGEDSFQPTAINGAVLKNASGQPYIPGSSLKGVLRAYLAAVMDEPGKSSVTDSLGTKDDREKWKDNAKGDDKDMMLAQHIEEQSTLTERLFGSQLMAGKVKISDAQPAAAIRTEIRKGNAIDRDTHTVADKALFDTEFVPSGTIFSFRVDAENLTKDEAMVFLDLLDAFADSSITVGGRSRAGLGQVRLDNCSYTVWKRIKGEFPKPQKAERDTVVPILFGSQSNAEVTYV